MKKILTIFSSIIVFLFILAIFGWMVNQIGAKNKQFGILTEPIKFMYSFPNLFQESVKEVKSLPQTYIASPKDFKAINKLEDDLHVLISYPDKGDQRTMAIMNLKDDSIHQTWTVDNPFGNTARILHPLLFPDGSLLYKFNKENAGLIMLGPDGEKVWQNNELEPHHSMNLDKDGNIWSCTYKKKSRGVYYLAREEVRYRDYNITKYDSKTGKILYDKSVSQIFKENDLAHYILKTHKSKDPLHQNDVQPALKTTEYYQEGDVFISLRNISVILHFRPSTNELIELIEGPFIHQHDVDFLNDSVIVMFNNNTFRTWPGTAIEKASKTKGKKDKVHLGALQSNIMSYNLKTKEFKMISNKAFTENNIHSVTEGLVVFLNENTIFVEQQNKGFLWVIQDEKVIYKNVLKSEHEGYHHMPNWTRVVYPESID